MQRCVLFVSTVLLFDIQIVYKFTATESCTAYHIVLCLLCVLQDSRFAEDEVSCFCDVLKHHCVSLQGVGLKGMLLTTVHLS